MAVACKLCLLPGGRGVSRAKGNIFDSQAELNEHIESEHDMPVQREDETAAEARSRFRAKNERAGGPDCRCPACVERRARGG